MNYFTNDTELTAVADAIRQRGGTSSPLVYPNGFVTAIQNIPGGGGGTSGSFTPESNTRTVSISLPSQPSGMFCCADYDGYPTNNTWKMFAFAYIDSTNGGFRVIRYGPSNYNIAARAADTFVYANGILTVTSDYDFISGVTYNWHAW